MSSTFAVGGTTATFRMATDGYKDAGPPPRELSDKVVCDSEAEFQNLLALLSWNVHIDRAPGGNQTWTDIGSGAGSGTLTDEVGTVYTAVLTDVSGDAVLGATEVRHASVKFLLIT